jgi:hypothetical protein
MLQAGRSLLRLPMKSLDISVDLLLLDLGSTHFLTESCTRKLPGAKGSPGVA